MSDTGAADLLGISSLINKEYVDENINFDIIEKLLEESTTIDENDEIKEEDIVKSFANELDVEVPVEDVVPSKEEVTQTFEQTYSNYKDYISDPPSSVPEVDHNYDDDLDAIAMKEEIDEILAIIEEAYPGITDKYKYLERATDKREIKNKLEYLRRKYNRFRSQSLGKEIILSGAALMEQFFDGKREIGSFRPDLTGWSNTIRPKVRRLQNETATIISDIMDSYKLGPWFRLGIELVPSAILYSRMRKMQYGQRGYTPDMMSEAYNDLRDYDK